MFQGALIILCIFINGCFWHGHNVALTQMDDGKCKVERGGTICPQPLKSSACCKIPSTNREFWVAKIRRNQQRDIEEQQKLAEMGWHCITIWECELNTKKREQTLKSLAYTLNKIWLEDHQVAVKPYPFMEEECGMLKAAEK